MERGVAVLGYELTQMVLCRDAHGRWLARRIRSVNKRCVIKFNDVEVGRYRKASPMVKFDLRYILFNRYFYVTKTDPKIGRILF